jgi:hypothetical protein
VSVAKKLDSLPQYSKKLGTNVDDKYEEVMVDLTLSILQNEMEHKKATVNSAP